MSNATMNELPSWVLRMVADVIEYESNHPAGVDTHECLRISLLDVPTEVLDKSRGYAQAMRDFMVKKYE